MSKIIASLIAGLFAVSAFAQTPAAAPTVKEQKAVAKADAKDAKATA